MLARHFRKGNAVRLALGALCLLGLGMAAAGGPGDVVAAARKARAELAFETVRISKPDGSVVELRVPRGRPLSLLGTGPGRGTVTPLSGDWVELGAEGAGDARVGGADRGGADRWGARVGGDLPARSSSEGVTFDGLSGRAPSGRVPDGRMDTAVRLSHPYLGTRALTGELGTLTYEAGGLAGGAAGAEGGFAMAEGADTRDLKIRRGMVAGDGVDASRVDAGWRPDGEAGKGGDLIGAGDFVVLEPGDGWDGPTQEPPPVGEPGDRGYYAKAIARWDVVPYQTIEDDFTIGVVAFHINGIDQVLFSVENGPWAPVKSMRLNDRTNVWEYTVSLRPSLFKKDGLAEVRAVVIPKGAGTPRLLAGPLTDDSLQSGEHSLFINTNANGTLPRAARFVSPMGNDITGTGTISRPYATILRAARSIADAQGGVADGGTIYLEEGEYKLGNYSYDVFTVTEERWLTIAPAPNARSTHVKITGTYDNNGLRTKLVRLYNLLIQPADDEIALNTLTPLKALLWLDGCNMIGRGRTSGMRWTGGWAGIYATSISLTDSRDGLWADLVRDAQLFRIGSDPYSGCKMVVNSSVQDINKLDTDFHPDVFQIYGPGKVFDNLVLYGLTALDVRAQGIFARGCGAIHNSAFVNVVIDCADPVMLSQWMVGETKHVLFWHLSHVGKPFIWRDDPDLGVYTPLYQDVSVCASLFDAMISEVSLNAVTFQDNHYSDPRYETPGTHYTTGDPRLTNRGANNFTPLSDSPLRKRIHPLLAPPLLDSDGRPRADADVGAVQRGAGGQQ